MYYGQRKAPLHTKGARPLATVSTTTASSRRNSKNSTSCSLLLVFVVVVASLILSLISLTAVAVHAAGTPPSSSSKQSADGKATSKSNHQCSGGVEALTTESLAIEVYDSSRQCPYSDTDVETAIKKGWWLLAQKLILQAHADKRIDSVIEVVRRTVAYVRKNSDELIRLLDKRHSELIIVSPAFQWAQSRGSLFLNIQFASRWNSPGALAVTEKNVTITDDEFYFSGIGEHSHTRKMYKLNFKLYSNVTVSESSYSFGSVGKLSVTLVKDKPRRWPRVTLATERISNMGVWWEMAEKYSQGLDDDEDEEETPKRKRSTKSGSSGRKGSSKDRKKKKKKSRSKNKKSSSATRSGGGGGTSAEEGDCSPTDITTSSTNTTTLQQAHEECRSKGRRLCDMDSLKFALSY
eukprot:Filipodium_phascolosomae@DN4538_c0_g1_i1.p1